MADSVQVVAFEGGELRSQSPEILPGEAVLALPLSRFIVRMVRVSPGEDPVAVASPVLAAMSPFPDEPLTVACETMRETDAERVVFAAALPEDAADDIADALDAAKINVTRIDALALGELRGLWSKIGDGRTDVRRLLLLSGADCISLFVLDDDVPVAVRALTPSGDLRREAMLSLLEAEDFGGAKALSEIVAVGDVGADALESFAPIRRLEPDGDAAALALAGVADRAADPSSLDALPESWRELLEETRFKAKLKKFLAVSGGIWALVMLVLFGVPFVFGQLTSYQRGLSREKGHAKEYQRVVATREKVKLVQKYSDHSHGLLETMRAVSEWMPVDPDTGKVEVTLTSWTYNRKSGEDGVEAVVEFDCESDLDESLYIFQENLEKKSDFFTSARFDANGVRETSTRNATGRWKAKIVCSYKAGEEG